MTVRFCRNCGRLNREDFNYCPYCGEAVPPGPGMEEALDAPFRRMEENRARDTSAEERVSEDIARMGARLEALEADVEGILTELAGARQDQERRPGA